MQKYGLIGYPLKHSFSQRFFSEKFQNEQINAAYLNFEISEIKLFPEILKQNPQLKGLNITIPYKEKIIPFLNQLDAQAESIGAVNVIKIEEKENGLFLTGYNSDIIGFQNSITPLIEPKIHQKALILGTGGASKAVKRGLDNLGLTTQYVSRSPRSGILSYEQLSSEIIREYTVIVNTTPLGTFPNVDEAPDIPYNSLTNNHLLYDLVYNPAETKFLKMGKEQGATTKNGYEMLELQALAAWKIWNT